MHRIAPLAVLASLVVIPAAAHDTWILPDAR